ncbi:unnamed protein product [Lactuca saligna]|uniref:PGG domain-containing protein n=1 Tax=Lactuca saligna TaxID=75948 RepID=A0AA35V2G3_LACSI|nr:unnamed protein product [Lactuca saligna]
MLRRAPSLLTMTDKLGETPLFCAARYGNTKSFYFFKSEMNRRFPEDAASLMGFLRRNNKETILHVAIHSFNFALALDIAKTYPMLIGEKDGDGMTALQLLACKSPRFKRRFEKHFICKLIDWICLKEIASRVPILKNIKEKQLVIDSTKELATLLIENDASWEETKPMPTQNRVKLHRYRGGSTPSENVSTGTNNKINVTLPTPDSPLILATKSGCTYIVKEILRVYSQAVELIDKDGRNILNVAIQYRRMEIYKAVIEMKYPLMTLRDTIDNEGNSLLHMVAMKATDQLVEMDFRYPAHELKDDLLLFESVKNICTSVATSQVNNDGLNARQLFVKNMEKLRIDAKEWMKSTAWGSAGFGLTIATLSFTASYTVPGGLDQNTGHPIMGGKPFFIVFTLANGLSLTFSITSLITFLFILTSSFQLKDFKRSLHCQLLLGLTLVMLSVLMMMISFAASLILGNTSKKGQDWTKIILYTISFLPVTVLIYTTTPVCYTLLKVFKEILGSIIASILPTCSDVESRKIMQHRRLSSQAPTTSSIV